MKLSELIEKAKITLELFGDGEVYELGDCGEHYTDFSFLQEDCGYGREKSYRVFADFPG